MPKPLKRIVIHQPDFLPYIGFFDRLKLADQFVILDHVQLSKSGFTHRDKILTSNGVEWLTVPVVGINKKPLIKDALIAHGKDFDKLIRRIYTAYRQSPNFPRVFPMLEGVLCRKPKKLIDLNLSFIEEILQYLNIDIPILFSSSLNLTSTRSEMNAEITQLCGGNVYISGMGAKDYHIDQPFWERNLRVEWRSFDAYSYHQLGQAFEPNLSIIDYLMNVDRSKILETLGN